MEDMAVDSDVMDVEPQLLVQLPVDKKKLLFLLLCKLKG